MKRIDFNKWLPDGDPKIGDLVECNGVIPYDGRLNTFPKDTNLSSGAVSSTTAFVIFNVLDPSSNNKTFVGTNDKIYRLDSTALTDVSVVGGYALSGDTWDWCVYGDNVVMTGYDNAVQVLADIDAGAAFAALGGSPTNSKCCSMYKDHLFLGNQASSNERRLQISASGDITDFVASTSTGAGVLTMPSWGESVIALKPIGNYLAVYMTHSIYLVNFIGAPLWFSATRISTKVGALSVHSVIAIDKNTHLILDEQDIYMLSGSSLQSIGAGVRQRVLNSIDPTNRYLITHSVDTDKKTATWAYPSVSGDGTPDKLLIYNYEEGRFSEADYNLHCIGNILSPSMTINGLDTYYSTINDVGVAFDSAQWKGGAPLNGCITDANKKAAYFGDAAVLDATLETGEIDFEDVVTIRQMRPIIEKAQSTITATLKSRFDDNDEYTSTQATTNANGLADLRATGRYQKLKLGITGSHSGIRGCKFDAVAAGER